MTTYVWTYQEPDAGVCYGDGVELASALEYSHYRDDATTERYYALLDGKLQEVWLSFHSRAYDDRGYIYTTYDVFPTSVQRCCTSGIKPLDTITTCIDGRA